MFNLVTCKSYVMIKSAKAIITKIKRITITIRLHKYNAKPGIYFVPISFCSLVYSNIYVSNSKT